MSEEAEKKPEKETEKEPEKEPEKKPSKPKKERKIAYRFGSRKLQCYKPTYGYPTKEEAKKKPIGKLKLNYCHGYSGKAPEARQNLLISPDGNFLIYYIAAVAIVFDYKNNTQKFFTAHNDDLTAICMNPKEGSTLIASGQTDPIDRPGEGKDLPKVWVWDSKDLSKVELINNICWGFISKIGWSEKTGYIHVLCGDESQTLKTFNPEDFKSDYKKIEKNKGKKVKKMSKQQKKKKEQCNFKPLLDTPTFKEKILGMVVCPEPDEKHVDEILLWGKRKFSYIMIKKANKGLENKTKGVGIGKINKNGEKSFTSGCFLPGGFYAVGASSGSVYIGKGYEVICQIPAVHAKMVGVLLFDGKQLYSGGYDKKLKTHDLPEDFMKCKGKKCKKNACLKETSSKDVSVQGSDMVFLPKAICLNKETGNVFVGTKSNQIVQIEEKETKVIVDGHDGDIWGLATHPEKDLFVTGAYDNAVKLWDANTLKCTQTHEFKLEKSQKGKGKKGKGTGKEIVTAAWSNNGRCIVFGTEDSNLAVFSFNNETNKFKFELMVKIPKKNKNAEEENISYVRFSKNSKYLAVAHMDSNLYVYKVLYGKSGAVKFDVKQKWKPFPHSAAPTHIQWSEDGKMLKTLTRDYEVCHWKLLFKKCVGKHVPNVPDPDIVSWADDPLVAGWDVQGLYQEGFDGTDLNDATLTSDGKLVITGDDYGIVRIHNYPAIDPSACYEYTGHAEFVVGVELLRSDKQLISCGGADMAIFQWELTMD